MDNKILMDDICQFAEKFELAETLREKTFLVTGATGLIGSVMIKCLLELNKQHNLGLKIIAVVRNLKKAMSLFGKDTLDLKTVVLELSDIGIKENTLRADYVIHLASPTASLFFVENPVETLRATFEGTVSVLEYAKLIGVRSMLMASSLEVYGTHSDDEWITEDYQGFVNPIDVRSSYNMGKRAAECLCHAYAKEYGIPVKIARLTQTTGAGISKNDNRVIAQFSRLAARGEDIVMYSSGESARPYCYTTDAVSALLYILLKGNDGEAYNVANEDTYISAKGIAEILQERYNPAIKIKYNVKDNMGYAPTTRLHLSSNKLKKLGWKPSYGLNDIIRGLIDYIKSEGDEENTK